MLILQISSKNLVAKLSKYIRINNNTIKLIKSPQTLYKPIYSPKPVKLSILKTYMKLNLAQGFIKLFKSPENILVFFIKKPNYSLYLYINYQDINNLTM